MLHYSQIRAFPTTIKREDYMPGGQFYGGLGIHESVLRSYLVLQKVKDLLGRGCPHDVLLEIIEHLEGNEE